MFYATNTWDSRWARRSAPKTTISVKLTGDELKKLDSLRKKKHDWSDELEPRGDVLRRLLEQARKNHRAASTPRKTKASSR